MAQWCESCGQQLPDGVTPNDAIWLGEPAEDHVHGPSVHSAGPRPGREKRLLLAVGALVAVWGLFVLGAGIVSPDGGNEADEAAAATANPTVSPYQAADAEPGEAGLRALADEPLFIPDGQSVGAEIGDAADALMGVGEPASDALAIGVEDPTAPERQINTVQVNRIRRQLERRDSNAVLAYRAAEGIVVIDLRGGTSEITPLTTGATTADAGLHLLRSGPDTFGISPETGAVAQVVDDGSILITRSLNGATYFVIAAELATSQAPRVNVVADDALTVHLVPTGHQLLPLDGLGLVAVPKGPTGATLIAGADSFDVLSEHRVLTGNAVAMLEQICDTPITCALAVTVHETGERWQVPADFVRLGDNYLLSPDGLSLLRYTDGGWAEVYGSADDSVSWVIGSGMQAPAWGPSSTFIAWLELVGTPQIKVMFPDERDWLTIDVADMGAPPPTGPEIIVYTPAPADSGVAAAG